MKESAVEIKSFAFAVRVVNFQFSTFHFMKGGNGWIERFYWLRTTKS
jgi:hypothetical protein